MLLADRSPIPATDNASGDIPLRRLTQGTMLFGPLQGAGQPCQRCVDARLASQGHAWSTAAIDACAPALFREATETLRAAGTACGTMLSHGDKGWRSHLLLPVPGCICMRGWWPPAGLSLDHAVDPLVGIVGRVESQPEEGPDGEACILALAHPCRLPPLGGLPSIIDGAGFGQPERARQAAIGEVLERYCASFIPSDLPICAARDLGEDHIIPSYVSFAGEPIGADQRLRWVRGRRLIDDALCWVQASATFFPYPCHDDEPGRSWGGSEGLAAGSDRKSAIVHATHEVLERDAFIRAWRFGGARRSLPSPFTGSAALRLVQIDNRHGIPVVSAFLESPTVPLCTAGIAARWTVQDAARVAALEALGARALDRLVGRSSSESVEARHGHACDPNLRAVRDHWCAGSGRFRGPPIPAEWDQLVLRIPDAVVVDITTPDVAALGVTVVRVIIPGCHGSEPVRGVSRIGGNPAPTPF
ncbi:YcaO-like family protein (plasmid) [Sphingobium sp. SJ10-10]|uniref:YcaO-like family protein n=1 Tax=Sphingobium sp. SJ10-10 TaxID=3114999 RepID=UPI002E1966BC|nr:YcaO-like family protein [Sphingobium sp. SJ10-10]